MRTILPFDESTSSGDQSNILDPNVELENGTVPAEVLRRYRPYAVSLRSLIRVKMADEADLKQVCLELFSIALYSSGI